MQWLAYSSEGSHFSHGGRIEAKGIIGALEPASEPVVEADSLEDLELKARAYLERFHAPLYLADSDNRVYAIVIDNSHLRAVKQANEQSSAATAISVFSVTVLVAAPAAGSHWWALVLFSSICIFYRALLKTKISNAIEAAVICEILLVMVLFLAPTVREAMALHEARIHAATKQKSEVASAGPPLPSVPSKANPLARTPGS